MVLWLEAAYIAVLLSEFMTKFFILVSSCMRCDAALLTANTAA